MDHEELFINPNIQLSPLPLSLPLLPAKAGNKGQQHHHHHHHQQQQQQQQKHYRLSHTVQDRLLNCFPVSVFVSAAGSPDLPRVPRCVLQVQPLWTQEAYKCFTSVFCSWPRSGTGQTSTDKIFTSVLAVCLPCFTSVFCSWPRSGTGQTSTDKIFTSVLAVCLQSVYHST